MSNFELLMYDIMLDFIQYNGCKGISVYDSDYIKYYDILI